MTDAGKNVISGSFSATGQSASSPVFGFASVLIEGGAGTVAIERSYDAGVNWHVISTDAAGTAASFTPASDVAFNGRIFEAETQVLYRFNCTAYTSGTINYRLAN